METKDHNDSILPLWDSLRRVFGFTSVITSRHGSQTGWTGDARGTVEITESGDTLDFLERGVFQPAARSARTIRIHNHYRWQQEDRRLKVFHCRQGPPVFIVELRMDSPAHFRSWEPHVCGEDRYRLDLHLADAAIHAEWRITGPRKNEKIACTYSH